MLYRKCFKHLKRNKNAGVIVQNLYRMVLVLIR